MQATWMAMEAESNGRRQRGWAFMAQVWAALTAPSTLTDTTREIETMLAAQMGVYCLILALPGATFTLSAYRALGQLMAEEWWAALIGAIALTHIVGILKGWRTIRAVGLALTLPMFLSFFVGFVTVNPLGVGWGGNLILFIWGFRALRRLRRGG